MQSVECDNKILPQNQCPSEMAILNEKGDLLGYLRLVKLSDTSDEHLIADITRWRNANQRFFMTQFNATEERTRDWLRNTVVNNSSRAMYMIVDVTDTNIGHLGVIHLDTEIPELDNMIRGVSQGDPKIMYWAEVALINFLLKVRGYKRICLHVFSNNWIPTGLHQSIGFKIESRLNVSKRRHNGEIHYLLDSSEGEPQSFKCLLMNLDGSVFSRFIEENTNWSVTK